MNLLRPLYLFKCHVIRVDKVSTFYHMYIREELFNAPEARTSGAPTPLFTTICMVPTTKCVVERGVVAPRVLAPRALNYLLCITW